MIVSALAGEAQYALRRDLEQLWDEHNIGTDGATSMESEYLEVVALRE